MAAPGIHLRDAQQAAYRWQRWQPARSGYVSRWRAPRAVQEALESGASKERAVERVGLPQYGEWRGYDDWFSMNVEKMYDWLNAKTE